MPTCWRRRPCGHALCAEERGRGSRALEGRVRCVRGIGGAGVARERCRPRRWTRRESLEGAPRRRVRCRWAGARRRAGDGAASAAPGPATTAYLVPVWSIFLLRGPHPRPVAVRGVKTLNETMRLCVFLFGNPGASGALYCAKWHRVIDVRSRGLTRTPVAALRSAGSHSEVSHWRGASAVRI